MAVKTVRGEQSEFTRTALLIAARELFATRGYADTSTEEIVQMAGVTRGALYYQFRDKEDLFRAVYHELERELQETLTAQAREIVGHGANAWAEIKDSSQAFLDACLDRDIQRIALVEAPSVLGHDANRAVSRFGLELLRRGLQSAVESNTIDPQPVEPLAHLLRAALQEGARLIAVAPNHAAARAEVGAAVDRLIEGLRRAPDSASRV